MNLLLKNIVRTFEWLIILNDTYLQNRVEDLRELEDLTGTEDFLVGKICIARYGKIYRGNKVHNCQNKGAIGIFALPENKYL